MPKLELTIIIWFKCWAFGSKNKNLNENYYKFEDKGPQGTIKIALKYNPRTNLSAIEKIVRVSKPGLRKYVGFDNLPRVINGLGVAILSTSKGVITDKEARKMKIGGEVLCYVY